MPDRSLPISHAPRTPWLSVEIGPVSLFFSYNELIAADTPRYGVIIDGNADLAVHRIRQIAKWRQGSRTVKLSREVFQSCVHESLCNIFNSQETPHVPV